MEKMSEVERKVRAYIGRKLGVNPDGAIGRRRVDAYLREIDAKLAREVLRNS